MSTNSNVFRNNGIHASIDHNAIKDQKIALSKSNFKMGLANVNYTSTSSLYHSPKDSSQTYGKDYRTSRLQANIQTNFNNLADGSFEKRDMNAVKFGPSPAKEGQTGNQVANLVNDLRGSHFTLGNEK